MRSEPTIRFEEMLPCDLVAILASRPVAYVPMATLEFHGWYLPFGFDALKAHALCERIAMVTGGVVLPSTYFGFAGGHKTFAGTIMSEEEHVTGNLHITLNRLRDMGFKVIVVLTGHYPAEQMDAVARISRDFTAANPDVHVIGLAEAEAVPGEFRGDHAGKWETSLGLELVPELVDLTALDERSEPLHGIYGEPPSAGSAELVKTAVKDIIDAIATRVPEWHMLSLV